MNKQVFKDLFLKTMHEAISQAERVASVTLPNRYVVEMHGGGFSGKTLSCGEAVDHMC
jgi:hypothetical protein